MMELRANHRERKRWIAGRTYRLMLLLPPPGLANGQQMTDLKPARPAPIAIQDTRTLRLRREQLIALARQHPDLSLDLINVLGVRLREANNRIADLTRAHPRELHRLFDQFT
jgi:CRP-like cAMP-binding protein